MTRSATSHRRHVPDWTDVSPAPLPNQYPYRWALGGDLQPGESIDVVGSVRLHPGRRPALGTGSASSTEPNVVTQDGVEVSDITVLASKTGRSARRSDAAFRSTRRRLPCRAHQGRRAGDPQAHRMHGSRSSSASERMDRGTSVTVPPLGDAR